MGQPDYRCQCLGDCCFAGLRSEQLCFGYGGLCLGRLWRCLWAYSYLLLVLEAHDQKRSFSRSCCRGSYILILKQLALFGLYEIVPGFILSSAAIYITSMLGAPPSQEIQDEFEAVNKSTI